MLDDGAEDTADANEESDELAELREKVQKLREADWGTMADRIREQIEKRGGH